MELYDRKSDHIGSSIINTGELIDWRCAQSDSNVEFGNDRDIIHRSNIDIECFHELYLQPERNNFDFI
jgi:hypothetical protein